MALLARTARWWRCLVAVLVAVSVGLSAATPVAASDLLVHTDPAANGLRAGTPLYVRLWFSAPLLRTGSSASLYRSDGTPVATPASFVNDDPKQLTLPLARELPPDTYTVDWYVRTATGGIGEGIFAFRIGSGATELTIGPPDVGEDEAAGRFESAGAALSLLGLFICCGAVVGWGAILEVALRGSQPGARLRGVRYVRRIAYGGVLLAAAGVVVLALVEVQELRGAVTLGDLGWLVSETRSGRLLMLQLALLLGFGIVLRLTAARRNASGSAIAWPLYALAALLLVPTALNGHAEELSRGQAAAFANDWLHLAAGAVWIGGWLTVAFGLWAASRGAESEELEPARGIAIQRFSTLALSACAIVFLTGVYAGWLYVGNLEALRQTSQGNALLFKALLFVGLFVLSALNLLWLSPRFRTSPKMRRSLPLAGVSQVLLSIAIVAIIGWMLASPTARQSIAVAIDRYSTEHVQNGVSASLFVSPGAAGLNRYTVDLAPSGTTQVAESTVLLRASPADEPRQVREIELDEVDDDLGGFRYEALGRDLSMTGRWSLELVVERDGLTDLHFFESITVGDERPMTRLPDQPPLFVGNLAPLCVLVVGLATVGSIVGMRWTGEREQGRLLALSSAGLMLFAVLGLAFAFSH